MSGLDPRQPSDKDDSADHSGAAFQRELEERLSILAPEGRDFEPLGEFNGVDYLLMLLFVLVLPVLAMYWGWR